MKSKEKKLVSFNKLESSLKRTLLNEYPNGFSTAAIKIEGPTPFYAVLFEHEQTTYLVKLNNYLIHSSVEIDDEEEVVIPDEIDTEEE